jgi:hypothetical protein
MQTCITSKIRIERRHARYAIDMLNIGKAIVGNDTTALWGADQSKPNAEITLLFVSIVIDPGVQLSEPNVTLPIRRQPCAISSNFILMITAPKNMLWV